ncbi:MULTISPECIES: 50S ribosomal protein L10 [Oceanibaculum]|uniref:Large ribosomal subunit protein uL10 n=2 Tax=Oceanibaculum indicum TaxID=526216 RepID=K2IXV0_9PROT|nr:MULTISPECIES: 50S ribosomal protein L10 [Oceanibaculum]EKE67638.1 50S ribosomal protein L10 [Oceanibaculum indicum P24]MCH2396115.1 50S ribosomal protein L10 [Oceanibaculum sp.]RKQ67106.1 large subunit ribosomal protein L10 [Oceanibaculum indicum]
MNRTEKEVLVGELNRTLSETAIVVVTRQSGLTVAEVSDLRAKMRKAGARYKVTKNRLARLALKGTQFEQLDALFTGPTAISTSADPVAVAKVAVDFAKANDKLTIVGGAFGNQMLDVDGIKNLATLPSLDELRGKIVGLLQAPATKLAGVVQAPAAQLARVLNAKAQQG